MSGWVSSGSGMSRYVKAWQASRGESPYVVVSFGMVWQGRHGESQFGKVRFVGSEHGEFRRVLAGGVR